MRKTVSKPNGKRYTGTLRCKCACRTPPVVPIPSNSVQGQTPPGLSRTIHQLFTELPTVSVDNPRGYAQVRPATTGQVVPSSPSCDAAPTVAPGGVDAEQHRSGPSGLPSSTWPDIKAHSAAVAVNATLSRDEAVKTPRSASSRSLPKRLEYAPGHDSLRGVLTHRRPCLS